MGRGPAAADIHRNAAGPASSGILRDALSTRLGRCGNNGGHERQPCPPRRPASRLRPRGRPPGHRDPRLHRLDRHPGHRPGAAQPRPLPGHRALRRRRPGRAARRAGAPAAGAHRRRRRARTRCRALREALRAQYGAGRAAARDPGRARRGHRARRAPTATPCSTASPAPSASPRPSPPWRRAGCSPSPTRSR